MGHAALLVAGSVGWTEPASAGHPAAGDAQGKGSGQVWARGPVLGARRWTLQPAIAESHRGFLGWALRLQWDRSLGAWAGLSQVQVGVATHPAGPEVHSPCPGLYPDAGVSDPLRVPGEPQPELPTDSSIPKTRQTQEAA